MNNAHFYCAKLTPVNNTTILTLDYILFKKDAKTFYGRSTLIQQLLNRLANNQASEDYLLSNPPDFGDSRGWEGGHFLAIVDPIDSGKSSIVKASVLPAIHNNTSEGSVN